MRNGTINSKFIKTLFNREIILKLLKIVYIISIMKFTYCLMVLLAIMFYTTDAAQLQTKVLESADEGRGRLWKKLKGKVKKAKEVLNKYDELIDYVKEEKDNVTAEGIFEHLPDDVQEQLVEFLEGKYEELGGQINLAEVAEGEGTEDDEGDSEDVSDDEDESE